LKSNWEKVIEEKIADAKKRGSKKRGWVKLDAGWLTSSINYRMELGEIAVFSKLIVMADAFGPVPGLISDNDFRPMPYEYLAHQACCPLEIFKKVIEKGQADDSIFLNSHGIFLTHFDDYQFTEYDRQKPYRERKKQEEKANAPEELLLEENSLDFAKISTVYEENFGMLTPIIAEQLKDITSEYPLNWIEEAFKEACRHNARKLSYVTSILGRWKVDGSKPRRGQPQPAQKRKPIKHIGLD